MKAVELTGLEGIESLRVVEIEPPMPAENEILIEVKAAGMNFAELELIQGRYPTLRPLPLVIGFEAAGVVAGIGGQVHAFKIGDRVTGIVSSGGYAEYATANATAVHPIPEGISYSEASTIPIQGLSAYTLLKLAARPREHETVLVQAAAGGVGLYLVQLLKLLGVRRVIALASSTEKLDLVRSLGADIAINYSEETWVDQVRDVTDGKGVDVVLEAASGAVGQKSFRLLAPFGRLVLYGAKNIHDTLAPEQVRQVIYKNQTIVGFNFPTLRPEQISEHAPGLLKLVSEGKLKLFANNSFPLTEVKTAFEALSSRRTIGKVVLTP